MRIFISIEIPKEIKEEIVKIQDSLKKQNLFKGKFTKKENLHLTLKFLGEVETNKIENIKNKLEKISFKQFYTQIDHIGLFSEKFIRIVWLGFSGKEITELQKEIDEILYPDFEKENRFMGHLTIARVKDVNDRNKLIDFIYNNKIKVLRFKVKSFSLNQSILKPEGPEYKEIKKFNLL